MVVCFAFVVASDLAWFDLEILHSVVLSFESNALACEASSAFEDVGALLGACLQIRDLVTLAAPLVPLGIGIAAFDIETAAPISIDFGAGALEGIPPEL